MRHLPLLALLLLVPTTQAQDVPSIAEKTAGMTHIDGYHDVYLDNTTGKIWWEIGSFGEEFLYATAMATGLGSNDIGLDRTQLGGQWVVKFERYGPKVMLAVPNLDYRADTDNPLERKSVEDAFASGVLHGFTVAAESDGRVLVDATDFFLRDARNVVQTLQRSGEGNFRLDPSRSAPWPDMTKGFPENTEVEVMLTFTGDNPGSEVRSVAAVPEAFTVRQRHSIIKLPPPGYEPRLADPRAGYYGVTYADYTTPIGEDMRVRYISRHRLEKKDPTAERSEAVEPIIYYLDPGTPEPVRSALLEGGRWWNEAFEAAGFINAFRVEMLPAGADPLDVRYNVINWLHRSTRGWSYGSSITDPRTGEILKGHVQLGSLRVRQDYLIAEGLLAPYDAESIARREASGEDPMLEMALARIRQLSAHEIGHTIGIMHNFAASPTDRASVMDYPAPLPVLRPDGTVDLDHAYDTGIGEWDEYAVRYGYTEFAPGADEKAELEAILKEMRDKGLMFISDSDARAPGGAHPQAHLWDNGANPVTTLDDFMAIRRQALDRFGVANLRPDRPLALLEEVLVPLYLGHRYQVEAVSKLVGGMDYAYAMRGDGQPPPTPIPADVQERALGALLDVLSTENLALPEHIRTGIPPRPPGFGRNRELFPRETGLVFDPYAPPAVVADMVFDLLLHPERAARLTTQKDINPQLPDLPQVLTAVTDRVFTGNVPRGGYEAELERIVQRTWVHALLSAAASDRYPAAARSRVSYHLRAIHIWLQENMDEHDVETRAHRTDLFDAIDRWIFRPYQPDERRPSVTAPPGAPIGG
ncbi:MAG: zinc-dependent metalloprotease [Rhodothermales bacterium]